MSNDDETRKDTKTTTEHALMNFPVLSSRPATRESTGGVQGGASVNRFNRSRRAPALPECRDRRDVARQLLLRVASSWTSSATWLTRTGRTECDLLTILLVRNLRAPRHCRSRNVQQRDQRRRLRVCSLSHYPSCQPVAFRSPFMRFCKLLLQTRHLPKHNR